MEQSNNTSVKKSNNAVAFFPLAIVLVEVLTIVSAYDAAFGEGDLDFLEGRIKTPPISMLMYTGTGKRLGQVGLPLVSILAYTCLTPFFRGMERMVGSDTSHNKIFSCLRWSVVIAFAFLSIVGILPLQSDLPLAMKKEVPISLQSIVHQGSASMFFMVSILHMGIWLYFVTRKCSTALPFHYKNSPKSFLFKASCFLLCFFPFPAAILLHPVSPVNKRLSLTKADSGGIMQYALVTCISSFFASYSCELWLMGKEEDVASARKKKD